MNYGPPRLDGLSIVIPVYNEESRVEKTLERILEYIESRSIEGEVIVVDDGSTDGTVQVVKEMDRAEVILIPGRANRGKGDAVRRGVKRASKPFVLYTDADLSTPIEEVDRFLPAARDADVIIGSRALKDSIIPVPQPLHRRFIGRAFTRLVRAMMHWSISDTQCGFKLFSQAAARDLFDAQTIQRFCFDVEILYLARKRGYRIAEIPVTWRDVEGSKVSLLYDPARMFMDLIKIQMNDRHGLYAPQGLPT